MYPIDPQSLQMVIEIREYAPQLSAYYKNNAAPAHSIELLAGALLCSLIRYNSYSGTNNRSVTDLKKILVKHSVGSGELDEIGD